MKVRGILLSLAFIIAFLGGSGTIVLAQNVTNSKIDNISIDSLIQELNSMGENNQAKAEIAEQIGIDYYNKNDTGNAMKYFGISERKYKNAGDLERSNEVIRKILSIAINNKRYTAIIQYSLNFLDNSNKLYSRTGNSEYLKNSIGVYYLVATTCNILGDYTYGKEYFEIGESIEQDYKIQKTSSLYYIKSNYYYYQKNYKQSEICAYNGIMLDRKDESPKSYTQGIICLIRVQIAEGKIDTAKKNLHIIDENEEFIKSPILKASLYYYTALIQQHEKEYDNAISNYKKAYEYTSKNNIYDASLNILENLGNCYSGVGDYKNSSIYYKKYIEEQVKVSQSKQKISANIIINNHNNDPQNILNQIRIRKSEFNNKFLLGIIIAVIIVMLAVVLAYYRKKNKLKKLKMQLRKDVLTKAYNRRYITLYMNELVENFEDFSVVMLDIDNYKFVNDTYGHLFGDTVLKKIVRIINIVSSDKVKVCRYGGEEFLLVVKSESIDVAVGVSELIRKAIESIEWEHKNVITVSSGVAKFNRFETIKDTIHRADLLLYKAKQNGKNRVEY